MAEWTPGWPKGHRITWESGTPVVVGPSHYWVWGDVEGTGTPRMAVVTRREGDPTVRLCFDGTAQEIIADPTRLVWHHVADVPSPTLDMRRIAHELRQRTMARTNRPQRGQKP